MFKDADPNSFNEIILCTGYVDGRLGIDGLVGLIVGQFQVFPYQKGTLFLFCGRSSRTIRGLLWEGDGWLLLKKRLANGRFCWPRNEQELRNLSADDFRRLVTGYSIESTIREVDPKPRTA